MGHLSRRERKRLIGMLSDQVITNFLSLITFSGRILRKKKKDKNLGSHCKSKTVLPILKLIR